MLSRNSRSALCSANGAIIGDRRNSLSVPPLDVPRRRVDPVRFEQGDEPQRLLQTFRLLRHHVQVRQREHRTGGAPEGSTLREINIGMFHLMGSNKGS